MRKSLLIVTTAAALIAGGGMAAAQEDSGARPSNPNATITLEQKQRIRDVVLKDNDAPRVTRVDFSLTIGNVVPPSIRIAPVPESVAEAFPAWRGYAYFVLHDQIQDQIIIVNPRDHTIVAIIA
jgi:Protein of unknown function (DUF1236)